jgi:hypothetical protein
MEQPQLSPLLALYVTRFMDLNLQEKLAVAFIQLSSSS